jgi:tetratricopeptide (TPR) repeat protein
MRVLSLISGRCCVPALALAGALACPVAVADQRDPRLPELFEQLRNTAEPHVAREAESRIWRIWLDSGRDDVDAIMREGIDAMSSGRFVDAIEHFDRIVAIAPDFAEGWNKRATAYYLNEELGESVRDIQRTLELEPQHFGAISGMGLIFLKRGDPLGALDAFEAVLEIHPHSRGTRLRVEVLKQVLMGQGT